jgi:ubiquinone/menaquinone biosynthesis C-methylase UbiE
MSRSEKTNVFRMERIDQQELLDLGEGTLSDVAENLAEMQRFNDIFGGTHALTRHLYPRLLLHNRPIRLADLGTGGGGLPVTLVQWARRLGISLRVLAVDWSQRTLTVAARRHHKFPEINLVRADALCLPFQEGQVDYIISSLFLHHFSPDRLVVLLRDSYRIAARGLIMSDLARGWLPYLGFKLAQPLMARSYLTRQDGAVSIRRAYTPGELNQIAQAAGLHDSRVYSHFPGRMTLVVEK